METQRLHARLKVMQRVVRTAVNYFDDAGFLEIRPVMLAPVTDTLDGDPGSGVMEPPALTYGPNRLGLTKSMILQKQHLVTKFGCPIFIISPNIRLERPDRRDDRHAFEFSQIDFEMPDAESRDVFRVVEGFIEVLSDEMLKMQDVFITAGLEEPLRHWGEMPVFDRMYLEQRFGGPWDQVEMKAAKTFAGPFWVRDIPREFYEKEMPGRPGHSDNYDLIWPEYGEILSGGVREHEYEKIIGKFRARKLDEEKYANYLRIAKEGLAPSAGAGIGIERLTRALTRAPEIGDVQALRRIPGEEILM
jgi:asparaginyl-tRNA synthetase